MISIDMLIDMICTESVEENSELCNMPELQPIQYNLEFIELDDGTIKIIEEK